MILRFPSAALFTRIAGEFNQFNPGNTMKIVTSTLALTALALALATSVARADDSVAGKWKGEFDSQIGQQKYTFEFKIDGDKLTGKAIGVREDATNSTDIAQGKIDKDKSEISFVENLKFQDNEIAIKYTGKISGDEIKFHREVGDGLATEDFTAKRVKDTDAKSDSMTSTNAPAK